MTGVPTAEGQSLLQSRRERTGRRSAEVRAGRNRALRAGDSGDAERSDGADPDGSITSSASSFQNNWQSSGRVDHQLSANHLLAGRYLYNDNVQGGQGQITPPGLTNAALLRSQAASAWLNSTVTPYALNELRVSYQRYASSSVARIRTRSRFRPWKCRSSA